MAKAYVGYDTFICKVWPIRHGYVMMREYFCKVRQRFGCLSVIPAPNRHEWLFQRENVILCAWFGDFSSRSCAPFVAMWGLVRQPLRQYTLYVNYDNIYKKMLASIVLTLSQCQRCRHYVKSCWETNCMWDINYKIHP